MPPTPQVTARKWLVNSMTLIAFCVGNTLGSRHPDSPRVQASQAPGYIGSKISIMVTLTCQIFVCFALGSCIDRLNKKNKKALEGMDEDEKNLLREKLAYADETDRKSKFTRRHGIKIVARPYYT
jgi:ACS family allantoate permease-like MFS transporter